jgi:hypothetical protein
VEVLLYPYSYSLESTYIHTCITKEADVHRVVVLIGVLPSLKAGDVLGSLICTVTEAWVLAAQQGLVSCRTNANYSSWYIAQYPVAVFQQSSYNKIFRSMQGHYSRILMPSLCIAGKNT